LEVNGDDWVMVAKADEVPATSIKHVEFQGMEFSIINLGGEYYALSDRCGHMNAPISRGKIVSTQGKSIVVCPLHGSTYDVVTGKNLSGPVKPAPMDMSAVPKPVLEQLAHAAELSALIKVHDLESFEVERRGDDLWLRVTSEVG
jgi:nitrite reductase/ring-hydroxylating ferredoxin subunit